MPIAELDLDRQTRSRLSNELNTICGTIKGQFGPAETAFLDVGEALQTLCVEFEALARSASEVSGDAGSSLKSTTLPEIARVSLELLDELSQDSKRVSESLAALSGISTSLRKLHDSTKFLDAVAKRLNNLRISIAIESSRSDATIALFSAFTDEMGKIGELVHRTSSALDSDQRTARAEQDRAHGEVSAGLAEIEWLIGAAKNTISMTQGNIEELLTGASESLVEVSVHSQSVGVVVDEMVRALQSQDIVRQQLEHVIGGLQEAAQLLERSDEQDSVDRAAALVRLQEEHVRESLSTIRCVHKGIIGDYARACSEIEQLVLCLPRTCDCLEENNGKTPFYELVANTNTLLILQEKASQLEERSEDSASHAAKTAELLANHVEDVRLISGEIELRALNAAIKSASLGSEGLTLKVLADEVTKLSISSAAFVKTTVATLDEITTACEAMILSASSSSRSKHGSPGLQELQKSVDDAAESLGKACGSIRTRSTQLQSRISKCEMDISFLEGYANHLEEEADRLTRVSKELLPFAKNVDRALRLEQGGLSNRYTMEGERDLYKRLAFGTEANANKDEGNLGEGGCVLF
jgi:hypothetical protein